MIGKINIRKNKYDVDTLIKIADEKMYKCKRETKKNKGFNVVRENYYAGKQLKT
ncbi:MAG: hypothetical protein GX077_03730 [Tissierellia bacterium]|nr:hypothetical protein [Tissierellia bacterium]